MKAVVVVALVVAAALGFIAMVVFGLGDRSTFVSPPEAVVEDAVRAVQCRRYPQAMKYFTADARERLSPEAVGDATRGLESRVGRIEDVKGEAGRMAADDAEAYAVIRTDRSDEVRVAMRLRREKGEWRLTGLEGLAP